MLPAHESRAAQKNSSNFLAAAVPTRYINVGSNSYAYRVFGSPTAQPLLLINRFRGTLDDWDPELLNLLAADCYVITFNNAGFARSHGEPPKTLFGLAADTASFIEALGYKQVSVLGFSYGGYTSQQLALDRPDLVSRLILASSGPGFVEATDTDPAVFKVSGKPVNTDEDLLHLFFDNTPSSRLGGEAYLARLKQRNVDLDRPVAPAAISAQLAASKDIETKENSFVAKSSRFSMPVLIGRGVRDLLIPMHRAYTLFRVLPDAKLVIYPDSGHGFLFQYPDSFAREVLEFLHAERRRATKAEDEN